MYSDHRASCADVGRSRDRQSGLGLQGWAWELLLTPSCQLGSPRRRYSMAPCKKIGLHEAALGPVVLNRKTGNAPTWILRPPRQPRHPQTYRRNFNRIYRDSCYLKDTTMRIVKALAAPPALAKGAEEKGGEPDPRGVPLQAMAKQLLWLYKECQWSRKVCESTAYVVNFARSKRLGRAAMQASCCCP